MTDNYHIRLDDTDITITCQESVTVLDAFLNEGVTISYGCKNGICQSCKAELIEGRVVDDEGHAYDAGPFLTCAHRPQTDCVIKAHYCPELSHISIKTLPCKVNAAEYINRDLLRLTLRVPPAQALIYLPGQYLDLVYQGVCRSYSIANVAPSDGTLELHIKRYSGGNMSALLFDNNIQPDTLMSLSGPHGTFFVRDAKRPLVFLATGTGFAPIKAMVEDLLAKQDARPITLIWGCRKAEDLYSDLPQQWVETYPHIGFTQVLSGAQKGQKNKVYVQNHLLTIHDDLSGFDVYACGSLAMIDDARALLCQHGLDESHFYYDAFVASS